MPVLGCQLFFFSAMQRMPVAVALLIQYLAPVMLVAFVWLRTRKAPSALVLWGSAVAIVGLILVVDISGASFDLIGTLFALGAAVCVCAYFVISERAGEDLPPLALAAGGLLTGGIIMAILCVTGVMPFAAPPVSVVLAGAEVPWFVPLIWVAAIATTLGYAFGVMAVPRIGSRVASFVGLSEVLFALGFAWLFLAEVPAPIQFAGGALILVGVVLVRLDARAPATRAARRLSSRDRGEIPAAKQLLFPSRQLHERRDAVADHLAHDQRGLGALDALYREDAGIRVEQVLSVPAGDAHEQVDLAAQSVHLHDLGDVGQFRGDPRQVRLAHHHAHERLDREAQSGGGDRPLVGEEHAGALETGHARLHRVAGESEPFGEGDDGRSRIGRERRQQLEVDMIEVAHSVKH